MYELKHTFKYIYGCGHADVYDYQIGITYKKCPTCRRRKIELHKLHRQLERDALLVWRKQILGLGLENGVVPYLVDATIAWSTHAMRSYNMAEHLAHVRHDLGFKKWPKGWYKRCAKVVIDTLHERRIVDKAVMRHICEFKETT